MAQFGLDCEKFYTCNAEMLKKSFNVLIMLGGHLAVEGLEGNREEEEEDWADEDWEEEEW